MKTVIKSLIIGIVIAAIGVAIILITLAANDWKFKTDYEIKTAEFEYGGLSVVIDSDANTVKTEFYDGDKIEVTYPESKGFRTEISENSGKFIFRSKTKWYYSFFNWNSFWNMPETVIKLPKDRVYDISVKIGAGSVYLADGEYKNVNINIDAGTFNCGTLGCDRLVCDVDAGKININSVSANYLECDVDAGGVEITKTACPEILIDVDAGGVKMYIDELKSLYSISAKVHAGKCNVSAQTGTSANHKIDVKVDAGKVEVNFAG